MMQEITDTYEDLEILAGVAREAQARRVAAWAPAKLEIPLPEGVAPPTGPYRRLCRRCCTNASRAEKSGTPHPTLEQIPEVESFVSATTRRRIYLGTCTACTDLEFSANWAARFQDAHKRQDHDALERLQREKTGWLQRGRKFLA